MTRLFSDENIIAQWTNFFEKQCKGDIETIASNYPTTKSLTIDGTKLDEKLLTELTTQPYKLLFNDSNINSSSCFIMNLREYG